MHDALREALDRLRAAEARLAELPADVPTPVLDAAHADVLAARALVSEALVEAGHRRVEGVRLPWVAA